MRRAYVRNLFILVGRHDSGSFHSIRIQEEVICGLL